jgi:glycosyltransferase involved in cell wall biosynthesis
VYVVSSGTIELRDTGGNFRQIRVVVQQPALPAYRLPVFAALSGAQGLSLTVMHSAGRCAPSVDARGFDAVVERDAVLAPRETLRWSGTQWRAASGAACDVLVCEWNPRVISLLPALLRARHSGVGVVVWGHGQSPSDTPLRKRIRNVIGRAAHVVATYGQAAADRMVREGFDPARIVVVQNAIDQSPIQSARGHWLSHPHDLAEFRATHGLAGRRVVLFSSRLHPAKRVDLLVEATAELVRRDRDVITVIVGDGPCRGALHSRARTLGIGENIRFVGEQYDEWSLAPWFLSADVYCYPRTIGLSILHAFGYGLPVVTSDHATCHHPEFGAFTEGQTGLLYKDGSAAAMADSLGMLLRDDSMRTRMGVEARRVATEVYRLDVMVGGLERAIRTAAAMGVRARWAASDAVVGV